LSAERALTGLRRRLLKKGDIIKKEIGEIVATLIRNPTKI